MSSESLSRTLRAKRRAIDRSHEAAIAHLALCVANRDQCELDLKNTHSVNNKNCINCS